MSGEKSKSSGEVGEELASKFLQRIGWKNSLQKVTIDCNTPSHKSKGKGKGGESTPRKTHGEDQIFLYHNPFHDERTDIVHVSTKNNIGGYPGDSTLRARFKEYAEELSQTIECASHSPTLSTITKEFHARKMRVNSGLFIWLHNDMPRIEEGMIDRLSPARVELNDEVSYYVVDNRRASFLLKVVADLEARAVGGTHNFYYPRSGTTVTVSENRIGTHLPLELIASDIVPAVVDTNGKKQLLIYADEPFSAGAYKNLAAYGLSFCAGLVEDIVVGFPDYNPVQHSETVASSRLSHSNRRETVSVVSFTRSLLDLLDRENQ